MTSLPVVDRAKPDGSITQANLKRVDDTMTDVFLDSLKKKPGHALIYRIGGWHQEYISR